MYCVCINSNNLVYILYVTVLDLKLYTNIMITIYTIEYRPEIIFDKWKDLSVLWAYNIIMQAR